MCVQQVCAKHVVYAPKFMIQNVVYSIYEYSINAAGAKYHSIFKVVLLLQWNRYHLIYGFVNVKLHFI